MQLQPSTFRTFFFQEKNQSLFMFLESWENRASVRRLLHSLLFDQGRQACLRRMCAIKAGGLGRTNLFHSVSPRCWFVCSARHTRLFLKKRNVVYLCYQLTITTYILSLSECCCVNGGQTFYLKSITIDILLLGWLITFFASFEEGFCDHYLKNENSF